MNNSNNETAVVRVKGCPLELGGRKLIVPPLPLGALEQLLPRINNFQAKQTMELDDISVVIDSTHAALKRNYPDIERQFIADNLGLESFQEVMEMVMDVSGLKRKAMEAEAAGEQLPA